MDPNVAAIWIASIGGFFSILTLITTAIIQRNQTKIHKQYNSRMDEFFALIRKTSKAEGNAEGREDLKKEQKYDKVDSL